MRNEVRLKRLKKLREVFASAEEFKGGYVIKTGTATRLFHIADWADEVGPDSYFHDDIAPELANKLTPSRMTPDCGTACCVAGAAGFIPEFRKAGLITNPRRGNVTFGLDVDGDAAFEQFFGLTSAEATDVCYPKGYADIVGFDPESDFHEMVDLVKPPHVVTKLDQLIAKYEGVSV